MTLALTHFNRYWFLLECFDQVKDDPRIGEIVISDDCSTDGSYEKLTEHFKDFPKVHLFRNTQNLDCYFNKKEAVERSVLDWVILFDSDNVISKAYLDVLFNLPQWRQDVLYCPDFAQPHFNYTRWAGKMVHKGNVAALVPIVNRLRSLKQAEYGTALNTCNYFFHRDSYLQVWDGSVNPYTADTIFHAYNWLKSGKQILIVPGLRYYHRVHEESHYKLNRSKTGNFAQSVEQKLRALR